jgi:hypothetical protein
MKFNEEEIQEIADDYASGMSARQIALCRKTSDWTIRKLLALKRVRLRSLKETGCIRFYKSIPMTSQLMEIIDGELLGDGGIINYKYGSSFSFSTKHNEYAIWLASFFSKENVDFVGSGVRMLRRFDKRTGKRRIEFNFRTKSTSEMKEIGQRWYKGGRKVIPLDLSLSNISLLHWWLGDGSRDKKSGIGHFCTDAFTEREVCRLSRLLNNLIGIESRVVKRKNPNGNGVFRIQVSRLDLDRMFDFIGDAPLTCLAYRWSHRRVSSNDYTKTVR